MNAKSLWLVSALSALALTAVARATPSPSTPAPACRLDVFSPAERDRHAGLLSRLVTRLGAPRRARGTWSFALPDDAAWVTAAEWITLERRCCPFLTFTLRDGNGGRALEVSGPPGTDAAIRATLSR